MGSVKEKEEKQGQGIPASSVEKEEQTTPVVAPATDYYAERAKSLNEKRNTIAGRLQEAYNTQKSINAEQEDVLGRFIRKPVQHFDEAKRLRRVAIAQALGELVGKIGEGIVAFGKGGEGYVTAPQGLYNKTIERMQSLRDKGVAAQEDYDKLMATIKQRKYDNDAAVNKAYITRLQSQLDDMDKQIEANESARLKRQEALADYERKRADEQKDVATKHENAMRLANQRGKYQIEAAATRAEASKAGKLTNDGAMLMAVLYPTNSTTSTSVDEFGETRTTTTTRGGWTPSLGNTWAPIMNGLAEVGFTPAMIKAAMYRNPKLASGDIVEWANFYDNAIKEFGDNE